MQTKYKKKIENISKKNILTKKKRTNEKDQIRRENKKNLNRA